MEKWDNRHHFYTEEVKLQKRSLTGEVISVESYYMINPFFQSQFLVLQLFK